MRYFVAIAIPFLAGCISSATATEEDSQTGAYALKSVDRESLPAPAGSASGSRWLLSGSLTLQPDGYYVLSERDSTWDGRAFARDERTEGGTWIVDGSSLTLTDTATEVIDTYGAATTAYFGSIASHAVLLTVPMDEGIETHIYRYER